MLIGGVKAPHSQFKYPTDTVTKYASSRFILNFTIDVSGYGALGVWVAYKIWNEASWEAFLIGLIIIGYVIVNFKIKFKNEIYDLFVAYLYIID